MIVGEKHIIHQLLVATKKIILPPFYIKLGLTKKFLKALNKDRICFQYLCSTFLGMIMEKIKAGIFYDQQIRQPMKDLHFANQMTTMVQWLERPHCSR